MGFLTLILLVALLLRLYDLHSAPPGLTHDEAGHAHDAIAILEGARPIYQRVGYGREPLYDYVAAGVMWLTGRGPVALRLTSALLGVAALGVSHLLFRRAFGAVTALASSSLQAVSFWGIATSRQALRSTLLPLLFAASVYCYWRAAEYPPERAGRSPERLHRHVWLLSFSLTLGATLYTYLSARIMWVVFPAFLLYLAFVDRSRFSRLWRPTLAFLLTGLLLSAPLFVYLALNPGVEQRFGDLWASLGGGPGRDITSVAATAVAGLAGLAVPGAGDQFLAYNIPGRPFLDPITGLLALGGFVLCLRGFREPSRALCAIWFLVGVSPSLLTGATASTTRGIGALPVLFLFPALAAVAIARRATARWGTWGERLAWAAFASIVLVTGILSARDYFVEWADSPAVRAAYRHTVVAMAEYLDERAEDGAVGVSTVYPLMPHDPYVMAASLARADVPLRWFDGGRSLVLPIGGAAQLLVPQSAQLDPLFAGLPGVAVRERVALRQDDLDPYFDVYDLDSGVAVGALESTLDRGGVAAPGASNGQVSLPAFFGGELRLDGYSATRRGGETDTVELVTLWVVVDAEPFLPTGPQDVGVDLVLFAHVVDGEGAFLEQEDRLDAPAWAWREGDTVVQIHRVVLPAGHEEDVLLVELGVYQRAGLARLPVSVDGDLVGDLLLLPVTEVLAE
jgi:4-amino-4-deoxy-L-arabinose transferase-like glycosyltransferase